MNTSDIQFLRHKITGRKYIRFVSGSTLPVSDLPHLAEKDGATRAIQVKCETCETWHPCHTMRPHATGLECMACTQASPEAPEENNLAAALRKAKALLRLATSSNANEAAAAAAKAMELIERYKLNISAAQMDEGAQVESDEPIEDFRRDPLNPADKVLARWKMGLAVCLAKINQCKCYYIGAQLNLIGRASDVGVTRYFFTYITAEIERLANSHCRGCGVTYFNNFRLGAVETVALRLRQQQQQTRETVKAEAKTTHALVLVQNSLALLDQKAEQVEQWSRVNLNLTKGKASRSSYHEGARDAGRRAGHSVNLNRPSAALRSNTKSLQ